MVGYDRTGPTTQLSGLYIMFHNIQVSIIIIILLRLSLLLYYPVHNMATVHGNEHRNREVQFSNQGRNNTEQNVTKSPTPQLPITQWENQSNDNEFTFWIDTSSTHRATVSDSQFPNLSLQDRATLVIGLKFKSKMEVYHFIQKAIRKHMIWEPACDIYDINGSGDGEFGTFCANLLQVMYSCIRTAKKTMLSTSLLTNMEIIALQKLSELHAGIEPKTQNIIDFTEGFLTPCKFKKRYTKDGPIDRRFKSTRSTMQSNSRPDGKARGIGRQSSAKEHKEDDEIFITRRNILPQQTKPLPKFTLHRALELQAQRVKNLKTAFDAEKDYTKKQQLQQRYEMESQEAQALQQEYEQLRKIQQQAQVSASQVQHEKLRKEELQRQLDEANLQQQREIAKLKEQLQKQKDTITQQQTQIQQQAQQDEQLLNNNVPPGGIIPPKKDEDLEKKVEQLQEVVEVMREKLVNVPNRAPDLEEIKDYFSLIDPSHYHQYSVDHHELAKKSDGFIGKDIMERNLKKNEKLTITFSGTGADITLECAEFITAIFVEAEKLIALGVFCEPLFTEHIVHRCIKGQAAKLLYSATATGAVKKVTDKVNHIIYWLRVQYNLTQRVKDMKKNFDNFDITGIAWANLVNEFVKQYNLWKLMAYAGKVTGADKPDYTPKYLVDKLWDKLPPSLLQKIEKIQFDNAMAQNKLNLQQEPEIELTKPATLLELHHLIHWAILSNTIDHGRQPQPTIAHGFLATTQSTTTTPHITNPAPHMNYQQTPYYPPSTTPRRGRGGFRGRGRGRGRGRCRGRGRPPLPYVVVPRNLMEDVEQRDTPIRQRPRYSYTTCQKCQIPGHHERDHKELQHYHDTIIHYARRYHAELQKRQRKMNNLSNAASTTPNGHVTPAPQAMNPPTVTPESTTPQSSAPRFFRQD